MKHHTYSKEDRLTEMAKMREHAKQNMLINRKVHPNMTKEDAQRFAIGWQQWASEQSLSYGELLEWQDYFVKLGERFALTDEFIENGII